MSIYIRKNMIKEKDIRNIIDKQIILKKEKLEKALKLETVKYIPVSYKEVDCYFNFNTFSLYPIFSENIFCEFNKNESLEKIYETFSNSKFSKNFQFELISRKSFKSNFFDETDIKIFDGKKIKAKNKKLQNFIVKDGEELKIINLEDEEIKAEKKEVKGYAIPVIEFINKDKNGELKEILEFLESNEIKILFSKIDRDYEEKEKKIKELKEIYNYIEKYEIKGKKYNLDEILKDIEKGIWEYDISEYKKVLIEAEKNKITALEMDETIFIDSNRGHWDLFYENKEDKDIKERECIKIKTSQQIYSRNPEKDINRSGVVALDFGSQSTVVAVQKKNSNVILKNIGKGSEKKNPTLMEFINVEDFLKDYNSFKARPFTKYEDLIISYDAKSKQIGGSTHILDGLKQWAATNNGKIEIFDEKNKKVSIIPFLKLKEKDLDPIEIYAYYIGCYINNMQNEKSIYLEYLLSFPPSFSKDIKNSILKSFKKGIKKSLPISIVENEEIKIYNPVSEPTSYFLCAEEEFSLMKEKDKIFYAVFDCGGGTTDYSFGTFEKIENSRRYDYELNYFGENGNKYLGGENILLELAYETFRDNQKELRKNNISFYRLDWFKNIDCEDLCNISHQSRYNMKILAEKFRNFWEETENYESEYQDMIKVNLLSNNLKGINLDLKINTEKLEKIIKERIEEGIDSFINSLQSAYAKYYDTLQEIEDKWHILLAGNSSNSKRLQNIFKEKIENLTRTINELKTEKIIDKKDFKEEEYFALYYPLGSLEARKEQEKNNIEIKKEIDGKTALAYGLLKARKGGQIKIISIDEEENQGEMNFKYYLGYAKGGIIKSILSPSSTYGEWEKFIEADEEETELYYSNEDAISIEDNKVNREKILTEVKRDEYIFVRAVSPNTIEYTINSEDEEFKEEKIKELKLK